MAGQPRYRVTEKIDAGGMAEVYRGIAESAVGGLKKSIAIKKILPSLTKNKKFVSMFLDEAKVSMYLQHANIVGVFDIGMADTAYFIVMEYVEGANLKTIIESLRRQGRRLPIAHTLLILMEVCKGLHYAHDATDPETGRPLNIVHRDISPPNILISKRGEVKLVDFGLAKASSQLESTDPGVVKGKFSYLSPEAASGKEVDRRADIFAVGILLYELLTGKRLFYGETDYQTVELVRQARVPAVSPQNPEVQPELEAIIKKALARDLSERFQTAADMQDALAQYLFGQRLKVTSRDIEQLVQAVIAEKQRQSPRPGEQLGSLIDELINEEILKFTSLDDLGDSNSPQPAENSSMSPPGGAASPGGAPLNPDSFIDTRGWVDDVDGRTGRRRENTGELGNLEEILEGTPSSPAMKQGPSGAGRGAGADPLADAAGGQGHKAEKAGSKGNTGKSPAAAGTGDAAALADGTLVGGRSSGKTVMTALVVVLLVLASAGLVVFLLRP